MSNLKGTHVPGARKFKATLPEELFVWLAQRADRNGRSMTGEVRSILMREKANDAALTQPLTIPKPERRLKFAILEDVQAAEAAGQ